MAEAGSIRTGGAKLEGANTTLRKILPKGGRRVCTWVPCHAMEGRSPRDELLVVYAALANCIPVFLSSRGCPFGR